MQMLPVLIWLFFWVELSGFINLQAQLALTAGQGDLNPRETGRVAGEAAAAAASAAVTAAMKKYQIQVEYTSIV